MKSDQNDFSIILPSNANPTIFPANKINSYTIKLADPIMTGDYDIALTELQFPCYWKNIGNDCFITVHTSNKETIEVHLTEGYYKDITSVMNEIRRGLSTLQLCSWIQFQWDDVAFRVIIIINNPAYKVSLSTTLARKFGFNNTLHFDLPTTVAENCADLNEGMTSFFIYCSAVDTQTMESSHMPLMRVIPVEPNEPGCIKAEEFRHPCYLSGKHNYSDLITIDIKRSDGQHVPFMTGKVNATLHFRKKK